MSITNPHTTSIATPRRARRPRRPGGVASRLLRQPLSVIALSWILLVVVVAIAAPLIAPYDPVENDFTALLQGPSAEHLLGTDENGRDVFSRILFGARIALLVGIGGVLVAMVIGVPIGLVLGYRGRWWDRVGTRFIDIFDALPGLLVAFAVIAILGRGLLPLMLAIGLMFAMNFARMARAITLAEKHQLYVEAAKVSGLRESAILFKQVLPNLAGPLIVQAAILTGTAIIIESALSFLGIGLEAAVPSWGGLLSTAADQLAVQPFLAIPPGLAILCTVLSFNMLGDGLNEALRGGRRKRVRTPKPVAPAPTAFAAAADEGLALRIRDLQVQFHGEGAPVTLVDDLSLDVRRGEIVGLLGESGSGKSTTARAVLGLLPLGIGVTHGSIHVEGHEIVGRSPRAWQRIRGTVVGAVFQDPMASLSPVHTIGDQLMEPLRIHAGLKGGPARARAVELLDRVGVRDAAGRLGDYPHQFSGGMAQRVAIAMALAASPKLLIADEATSALDVTTQAQVLDLLLDLRDEYGMAILLITHDLGVVAEACDRAAVMYKGELVEVTDDVPTLFDAPQHPYTQQLLRDRHFERRRPARAPLEVDAR